MTTTTIPERKKARRNNDFLSFWEFFQVFVILNRLELPLKDLHRDACDILQRAALGQLSIEGKSFIVISIPPRVGKTMMMVALCIWQLTYFPESQIIYTSYAGSLATESCRLIQETINSKWYQDLYTTRLGNIQKADFFTTTAGGKLHAEGVGGGLTGKGAGLKRVAGGFIVVDDPAKPDEALSLVMQEQMRFWFENTLKSRRNSSQWTPIIICAQRISSNDLPGFLLEHYPEETAVIKHAALVNGESIIPETVSTESLLATQRVNPFAFAAQYQQEPIMLGGNMIKTEDFFIFDSVDLKWEKKIITCDTAFKDKQHNDWSVLECWGVLERKAYLIDLIRGRWLSPSLIENSEAFYRKHNDPGGFYHAPSPVTRFTIEEAAAGIGLIDQLRLRGIPAIGILRTKDKVTRVNEILPYIVTHMVGVHKHAPWLVAFLNECAEFRPDGKAVHDDMVDAMVDGVWEALGKSLSIWDVIGMRVKATQAAPTQPPITVGAAAASTMLPKPVPKPEAITA